LARAQGAKHAISTTTNHGEGATSTLLGFDEVIDLSEEKLSDGVRRITEVLRRRHCSRRQSAVKS